jgi:hypothetical protein
LHQHIRRLDADADDPRQHPNHRMPASGRRPFQALQPSLLDGVDLLADPSQSGHVASHLIQHVGRNWRLLWSPQCVKLLRRREQSRLEAANAEPDQGRLHAIDDPRAFAHQDFALAAGTPGVFFLERGDRHHFAVTRLAAQPSQKHADEHLSIEPIRLGSAGLARYRDARRMHDEGLDATDPQPSSQPKPIAARLESENGPCDRSASFCRSIPPTLHQMQ